MRKSFMIMSVMTMALLNVSQANAGCRAESWGGTCTSSVLATEGTCGTGCSYTYSNGTITITADKDSENPEIAVGFFSKQGRENGQFTDEDGHTLEVTNVVIDGNIKFGGSAFNTSTLSGFTISGKDGTLILDDVDFHSLNGNNTLAGNIIWRGDIDRALSGVKIDGNLIIEDTATVSDSEGHFWLGSNGKVFCNTDMAKCQTLLTAAGANNAVLNALQPFPDGCSSLTSSGKCAKCKNNNFNLNDGECDRIRWTPAEVAKVLRDDDTNVVTITFKH